MLFRSKSSLAGASLLIAFILFAFATNVFATINSAVLEREVEPFRLEGMAVGERAEEEINNLIEFSKRDKKKGKKHHHKHHRHHKKKKHHHKHKNHKNNDHNDEKHKDDKHEDDKHKDVKHKDVKHKDNHKEGKQRHPTTTDFDTNSLVNVKFGDSQCSDPKTSKLRPNGCVSFLNCGIHSKGGWQPPPVKLSDLKVLSGEAAAQKPIFAPCKKYLHYFNSVQQQTGVPATVLMSFAMQESSCNKGCTGPNGEIGLMQITKENSRELGVNPADAWDPETNIKLGAKQFKQYLDQNNGNAIISIGMYNGWYKGLTEAKARNKQYGCAAQNNLDYIDSMLNGWFQGKDGYGKDFKTYNNLAECGDIQ